MKKAKLSSVIACIIFQNICCAHGAGKAVDAKVKAPQLPNPFTSSINNNQYLIIT